MTALPTAVAWPPTSPPSAIIAVLPAANLHDVTTTSLWSSPLNQPHHPLHTYLGKLVGIHTTPAALSVIPIFGRAASPSTVASYPGQDHHGRVSILEIRTKPCASSQIPAPPRQPVQPSNPFPTADPGNLRTSSPNFMYGIATHTGLKPTKVVALTQHVPGVRRNPANCQIAILPPPPPFHPSEMSRSFLRPGMPL